MDKYCGNCGTPINNEDLFCAGCGTKILREDELKPKESLERKIEKIKETENPDANNIYEEIKTKNEPITKTQKETVEVPSLTTKSQNKSKIIIITALLLSVTLLVLLLNPFAAKSEIDYYNTNYHNIKFGQTVYETVTVKNGHFDILNPDIDINSKQFEKKYFEDTGEKYIPGESELPYYYFEQWGEIIEIINGDLNSDNSDEVIIHFYHGYPGGSGTENSIFVFDAYDNRVEPIGHIYTGSRGMGGIVRNEDCNSCEGIKVKNGKLEVYVYDGTYMLDWSSYRIITYELDKDGLKKNQTSKKFKIVESRSEEKENMVADINISRKLKLLNTYFLIEIENEAGKIFYEKGEGYTTLKFVNKTNDGKYIWDEYSDGKKTATLEFNDYTYTSGTFIRLKDNKGFSFEEY